jgi:hypothetical protein
MYASQNKLGNSALASEAVLFETLEVRQLLSGHHHHHARKAPAPAAPAVVTYAPLTVLSTGNTLTLAGSTGSDVISLSETTPGVFTFANGTWSSSITGSYNKIVIKGNGGNDSITVDASVTQSCDIYGGAGNDTLTGGSGNDRIFAGAGANVINGGAGNDTIVTVGSTSDIVTGGAGTDSFWMDDNTSEVLTDMSAVEKSAGHVHRIGSFLNGVSKAQGISIADPKTTASGMSYKNFATLPLFSDYGPAEDDVVQGYVGDCWFLSSLSSVAKINCDRIRQSIVDLGDGTYAVQFNRYGQNVFVRVDADLACWNGSTSQVAYAGIAGSNHQTSLWVALMEKAMTQFRGSASAPSYSAIDGGWMSEAYNALGIANSSIWSAASATDWATQISTALAANEAVTYATINNPGGNLIGSHAYTVDHMGTDASGNATITLRNPWGVDGAGSDGSNDGYVTLTVQQAFTACLGATVAVV